MGGYCVCVGEGRYVEEVIWKMLITEKQMINDMEEWLKKARSMLKEVAVTTDQGLVGLRAEDKSYAENQLENAINMMERLDGELLSIQMLVWDLRKMKGYE